MSDRPPTPEEAAELILQNDPWERCPDYGGGHPDTCRCEGSGAVLKADYERAYVLLGRPHPPRWKTTKYSNGVVQVSGPSVFIGKFPMGHELVRIGSPNNPAVQRALEELEHGSTKTPKSDPEEK